MTIKIQHDPAPSVLAPANSRKESAATPLQFLGGSSQMNFTIN